MNKSSATYGIFAILFFGIFLLEIGYNQFVLAGIAFLFIVLCLQIKKAVEKLDDWQDRNGF